MLAKGRTALSLKGLNIIPGGGSGGLGYFCSHLRLCRHCKGVSLVVEGRWRSTIMVHSRTVARSRCLVLSAPVTRSHLLALSHTLTRSRGLAHSMPLGFAFAELALSSTLAALELGLVLSTVHGC